VQIVWVTTDFFGIWATREPVFEKLTEDDQEAYEDCRKGSHAQCEYLSLLV